SDFFQVTAPGSAPAGRTFNLVQPGDDPANNVGQWPGLVGSNFAVNPADPNGIIISSQAGRIFRTQDEGAAWFAVGQPSDLDKPDAQALAFGAPSTADLGNPNKFLYAGTMGGKIFVTFGQGGSAGGLHWINVSAGLDGSPIQQIVTNPKPDTHEAYA